MNLKMWAAALLISSGLIACSQSASPVVKPVMYEDLGLGYGLSIPAGWAVTQGYGNTALLVRPPVLKPTDHLYSLNVAVDTHWAGPNATLDDYLAFRLPRMLRFTSLQHLDASATSTLPTGETVWQHAYEYRTGPQKLRAQTRLFVSGGKGWAVTVTAPIEADAELWKKLVAMQASWKAKPAKPT